MLIEELAISGGGVKGLAFLGALYELWKQDKLALKRVSATSIGAFIGACIIAGYTPKELIDILFEYDFTVIKDIQIKLSKKTIMKGNKLNEFFETVLEKKINPNVTLSEFYKMFGIEFIVAVSCMNTSCIEYINYENEPDLPLIKLLRMTSAIPLILPPIEHKNKLYVDGGLIDNFPISCLSENAWGVSAITKTKFIETSTINLFQYICTILNMLKKNNKMNLKNVIYIDVGNINVTSFNVTKDQKLSLINSGRRAVRETRVNRTLQS